MGIRKISGAKCIGVAFFIGLLITVDQVTKYLATETPFKIVTGFFNIDYVLNPGAAFGIFSGQPQIVRTILFLSLTVVACGVLLYLIYKEFDFTVRRYAYAAVFAGAIGNAIDRVQIGKVVDFLDFHFRGFHWYTFNMADVFITVGVAMLLFEMLFLNKESKRVQG